ncbi:MAG: NAD(P)H-dependent glycerol-3-phosphate dehydrogenase [candidate division WOR-3 bacterium]
MKVAFIGAGRWALALALKLSEQKFSIALYDTNPKAIERLLSTRHHPDLPENAQIPEAITITNELNPVLTQAEMVVFALPSTSLAEAAERVKEELKESGVRLVVSASKGIDPKSKKRLSVVLKSIFPSLPVVVLAGPAIPYDVALGDPTSLVAVSEDENAARFVQDTFTTTNLRVYFHTDVVGTELAAAFKNVIAIAAGIADGLGLKLNAKSALLTRGLAEITRLGLALNANPLTFAGLAGMGDLIVTAFSPHSRNHQLGMAIGKGMTLTQAQESLSGVAEGVATARTGRELAQKLRVAMPITDEVYRILYEGTKPEESIERLLKRPLKKEFY